MYTYISKHIEIIHVYLQTYIISEFSISRISMIPEFLKSVIWKSNNSAVMCVCIYLCVYVGKCESVSIYICMHLYSSLQKHCIGIYVYNVEAIFV